MFWISIFDFFRDSRTKSRPSSPSNTKFIRSIQLLMSNNRKNRTGLTYELLYNRDHQSHNPFRQRRVQVIFDTFPKLFQPWHYFHFPLVFPLHNIHVTNCFLDLLRHHPQREGHERMEEKMMLKESAGYFARSKGVE